MILLILLLVLTAPAHASRKVIIIGGGPDTLESQVSIEINTRWIIEIIGKNAPELISNILYTDGNAPGPDVHKPNETRNEMELFEPLARVYNMETENGYQYYSSNLANEVEPADAEYVTSTLKRLFAELDKNDELLIIFQGHGGHNQKDTNKNYLRFWNDTRMTVTELEKLMTEANPDATIRFILPQCFSGAFSRLVYKDAQVKNGLAEGNRCGFVAQSEHLGSEGCTASVDTDTYRDYSSYFFSAISGSAINGDRLTENPDYDNDGHVTLREAHIYTLANAVSVDKSHSTSDDYLSNWQPWYLKWSADFSEPKNVYSEISEHIAKRYNISGEGRDLVSKVSARLKELNGKLDKSKARQNALKKEISEQQKTIKKQLMLHWPQLLKPYTNQYRKTLNTDIQVIHDFIIKHENYSQMVENQREFKKLEDESLIIHREEVQMTKIIQMRKMAKLLKQFEHYASSNEKAEYNKLLACENTRLFE